MTARLDLLVHGPSRATRAARFPDDEGLENPAAADLDDLRGKLRAFRHVATAPLRAARETVAALGLDAEIDEALRPCDYGRWRGLGLTEIAAREPRHLAAWRENPAAAPHGGDSLTALIERADGWLAGALQRDGSALAVSDASFIRAAVVAALGADASVFWRIDLAPLARVRLSGGHGRWTLVALGAWA